MKLIQGHHAHESKSLFIIIVLNGIFSFFTYIGLYYEDSIFNNNSADLTDIDSDTHFIAYSIILLGGGVILSVLYPYY